MSGHDEKGNLRVAVDADLTTALETQGLTEKELLQRILLELIRGNIMLEEISEVRVSDQDIARRIR